MMPSTTSHKTMLMKLVRALLIVVALGVVHTSFAKAALTTDSFTPDEQSNTLKFLEAFKQYSTTLNTQWTGTDFCSWVNVGCEADGAFFYFESTDLTQLPELPTGLDGSKVVITDVAIKYATSLAGSTLPQNWGSLTNMNNLAFSRNALTGTLPAAWAGMTALEGLFLDSNKFTGTLPATWAGMTSLQRFVLRENSFTGTLPSAWASMTNLEHIDLKRNSFTGALPAAWAGMTNLGYLDLTNNGFCGCLPSEWTGNLADFATVDAKVSASDCATANACPTMTPEEPTTATQESCDVSHCAACASGSPSVCATCSKGYSMGSSNYTCNESKDGCAAWPTTVLLMAVVIAVSGIAVLM